MSAPRQVVVTGMGVACASATGVVSFAAALAAGRGGIRALRGDEVVGDVRHGALLDGFGADDELPVPASLPEPVRRRALRAARHAPRPVRAALSVAMQAWDDARLSDVPVAGHRLGVVVAGHNLTDRQAERAATVGPGRVRPRYALQYQDTDHVATISHVLGITGEGCTVGGASASGGVGLVTAARLVAWGELDACLVVGPLVEPSTAELSALRAIGAMAGGSDELPAGPFDVAHRGFVYGQGSACVVLESAGSARGRGVPVPARIGGYSIALDGNNLADPDEDGQVRAMSGALRAAGVAAGDVGYVNAHGTASPLGDRTELRAVRRVLGGSAEQPWINSTKGLTGHCLAGAGVVEVVATVIQLRGGFVHPNLGLHTPVDTGLRLAGGSAERHRFRCALSNSFGFGGFNTSVLVVAPE